MRPSLGLLLQGVSRISHRVYSGCLDWFDTHHVWHPWRYRLDSLQKQNECLANQVTALEQKVSECDNNLHCCTHELEQIIDTYENRIEEMIKQRADMQSRLDIVQAQLSLTRKVVDCSLAPLKEQLADLVAQHDSLRNTYRDDLRAIAIARHPRRVAPKHQLMDMKAWLECHKVPDYYTWLIANADRQWMLRVDSVHPHVQYSLESAQAERCSLSCAGLDTEEIELAIANPNSITMHIARSYKPIHFALVHLREDELQSVGVFGVTKPYRRLIPRRVPLLAVGRVSSSPEWYGRSHWYERQPKVVSTHRFGRISDLLRQYPLSNQSRASRYRDGLFERYIEPIEQCGSVDIMLNDIHSPQIAHYVRSIALSGIRVGIYAPFLLHEMHACIHPIEKLIVYYPMKE